MGTNLSSHNAGNEDEQDFDSTDDSEQTKDEHTANRDTKKRPLSFATSSEFHAICSRTLCCLVALLIAYIIIELCDDDELPDI